MGRYFFGKCLFTAYLFGTRNKDRTQSINIPQSFVRKIKWARTSIRVAKIAEDCITCATIPDFRLLIAQRTSDDGNYKT